MKNSFLVVEDFCDRIEEVRASALASGFGTWRPNKGEVGSSVYDGMCFYGLHSPMLRSLARTMVSPVYPNNMFFRVTLPETERAYIHSDRMWGTHTCIGYLSKHPDVSGTAFYRHVETGLFSMPTFEEQKALGIFDTLKADMVSGDPAKWEQIDFVRGKYNRALIFDAPLFHSRFPMTGLGTDETDGRMVWACHFTL